MKIWLFHVTTETCIEFSTTCNTVTLETLSRKEEPQTDGQEAGMFPGQIRIKFHPLLENYTLGKSNADFYFSCHHSLPEQAVIYWSLHSDVSMISPFIRRHTHPVLFWTPIFVPLWDIDDLESAGECDIWLWWLGPIVIQPTRSHANVCAIATHLLPIEALPHQRGLVELWFTGRALLSGEGWFRTFQFISAGAFTHAGDSQGKFLVTLWCQGALWGRVGGTTNHTL